MGTNKKPKKKYVPRDVRYPSLVTRINSFAPFEAALDLLDKEILEYDWRHLVSRDLHILGIRAYRKQNNDCSLHEAKDACDAFRNLINM